MKNFKKTPQVPSSDQDGLKNFAQVGLDVRALRVGRQLHREQQHPQGQHDQGATVLTHPNSTGIKIKITLLEWNKERKFKKKRQRELF